MPVRTLERKGAVHAPTVGIAVGEPLAPGGSLPTAVRLTRTGIDLRQWVLRNSGKNGDLVKLIIAAGVLAVFLSAALRSAVIRSCRANEVLDTLDPADSRPFGG